MSAMSNAERQRLYRQRKKGMAPAASRVTPAMTQRETRDVTGLAAEWTGRNEWDRKALGDFLDLMRLWERAEPEARDAVLQMIGPKIEPAPPAEVDLLDQPTRLRIREMYESERAFTVRGALTVVHQATGWTTAVTNKCNVVFQLANEYEKRAAKPGRDAHKHKQKAQILRDITADYEFMVRLAADDRRQREAEASQPPG